MANTVSISTSLHVGWCTYDGTNVTATQQKFLEILEVKSLVGLKEMTLRPFGVGPHAYKLTFVLKDGRALDYRLNFDLGSNPDPLLSHYHFVPGDGAWRSSEFDQLGHLTTLVYELVAYYGALDISVVWV